jgi:cytochrome c oxidase subunit III
VTSRRIVGQLGHLDAAAFGSRSLWFWATVAFMLMEGVGFALALGSYVYLTGAGPDRWPLKSAPPELWAGSLQMLVMLVSLWPNLILARAARAQQQDKTRFWAVVISLITVLCFVIRAFEFGALNTRWDQDAYGSVVWALLLLHTAHIVSDGIGTIVMTIFLFTHSIDEERFSDVDDDCLYWTFVVFTWAPIYLAVYWAPRWIT